MRCEDIMESDLECVGPTDTVESAAIRMRDENVGFLPVCDETRKPLGTLTDRDIVIRVLAANKSPATTQLSDVMSREVISCRPSDDLRSALEQLAKNKKSRVMVLDDGGKLVGVISLSDIAQRESDESVARTLREVTGREATIH